MSKRRSNRLINALTRRLLGTVTGVATREPVAALTFDDGPHPEFTPRLLDLLERHGARGTFFVVGQAAQQHPQLLARMAQAGHAIGNHSWSHPSFPHVSGRERRAQMQACERAIAPHSQKLFRPPFGHQNVASRVDASLFGFRVVAWNSVAGDWLDHDAAWMADRVLRRLRPGRIILFHDALYQYLDERHVDRGPMLAAVQQILERAGGEMAFVTVPELLRRGKPRLRVWRKSVDREWLRQLKGMPAIPEERRTAGHRAALVDYSK